MGDPESGVWNAWHLADPLCTYLFSILVLFTTYHISIDCVKVLMEGAPADLDSDEIKK